MYWFKKSVESSFVLGSWNLNSYTPDLKWFNQTGDTYTNYLQIEGDFASLNYTAPAGNAQALIDLNSGNLVDIDQLFAGIDSLFGFINHRRQVLEEQLFVQDSLYAEIKTQISSYLKQIPSQGAIAGIYCKNDRERGAWKSPANIAVQGIEKPMVEVSNNEQDALNVDLNNGKSINVIRTFTGKGPIVWGARTLHGNSREWQYIAVRRFFNYAEESIKKSMNDFIFEPNNARTWVKIKAMITSFLVDQWRSGALVGKAMSDSFFVHIGEDTTEQAEILAGKINVQIGMAVARPAEFIIIEFSHQTKS